jgi:hypothetical protein
MFQIRLRQFMVLVLYIGVVLFLVLEMGKNVHSEGPDHFYSLTGFPFALGILSMLVLRPGPRRDWILALLGTLLVGPLLFPLLLVPLMSIVSSASPRRPVGQISPEAVNRTLDVFVCGLIWPLAVFLGRRYLIPQQCPGCLRKAILRSLIPLHLRFDRTFWHVRCGACNRDGLMRIPQLPHACPSCGRETLYTKKYTFYWCLNCHMRFKRLRRGAWEDASLPEEDGYYFVWSFGGWVRSMYRRAAGKMRARV